MSFLVVFVAVLIVIWIYKQTRKPAKFPPGPPRLPILGSLPFLVGSKKRSSPLSGIDDNIKKYGPVFGFYFGQAPAVVLADFESVRETFKLESLASRPPLVPINEVRPGCEYLDAENWGRAPGVIMSVGRYWKTLRRFMLRNLRDFGFGKSSMEEIFLEEVGKLISYLAPLEGEPINLAGAFNLSIVNALWSIIAGERLQLDDPNLKRLVDDFVEVTQTTSPVSPLSVILPFPSMSKWPILDKISGFADLNKIVQHMAPRFNAHFDEHQRTLDPDSCRDFLDLMLVEHQNASGPENPFYGTLGKFTILNAMIDLFFAGMETTSSSLVNLYLQILHHPEVQVRVHEEIDRVVGQNRNPSFRDLENLHYVNAVLHESFRVSSLVYIAVPHSTTEDIKLGPYIIPKGAIVMSSLYHIHHDPKHFKEPELFNPSRFIDESGKFVPNSRVVPFGIGKRVCLGQSLAEKEFFIFFVALMQRFEFRQVPGSELPTYTDVYPETLMRGVPSYEVILKKRY